MINHGCTCVQELLSFYNLFDKVVEYVRDEGGNLSTLAKALTSIEICNLLAFKVPWQGNCFGHAFNKALLMCM
jgi:hypothetical protein